MYLFRSFSHVHLFEKNIKEYLDIMKLKSFSSIIPRAYGSA